MTWVQGQLEEQTTAGGNAMAPVTGEEPLRFLAHVSRALAAVWEDPEAPLGEVARLAVGGVATYCTVDLFEQAGGFRRVAGAHREPALEPLLREAPSFSPGTEVGPLYQTLRDGQSHLFPDFLPEHRELAARNPEHLALMERLGPRSMMLVPLGVGGRTLGLFTFAACEAQRRYGPEDLAIAEELARRAAAAVEHARLLREMRRAERATRLLAEAGARLGTSLDVVETLESLARLMVPELAEGCAVYLAPPGEAARCVAVAHADPEKEALLRETAWRYPPDMQFPVLGAVQLEGPLRVRAEVTDGALAAQASDAEHLRLLRALGMRSLLGVALVARERVLGAVALTRGEGPGFSAEEQQLAEELARRAALSVDNARLYHEARDAVRLRDEFLGIASHELKTPLTPLHLKLQMLQKQAEAAARGGAPVSPGRLAESLEVLQRQVRKLSSLVDNLLDVSRITAGRLRLELEDMDLATVAAEVLGRFAPSAAQLQCQLELHAPVPVFGKWDRLRLEQVVTNLVSNALKYGAGRPVVVHVEADGPLARLSVRDGGIGISEADQKRIFERFERAVSEKHYGGLGLGLYITRQIVEAFGGTVRVSSALGQGSTFTLEVPRGDYLRGPVD
ncbi:HAMP domain-containing sensor histidine kinase [Myxococcaceae bacterium GXIMD 01537]